MQEVSRRRRAIAIGLRAHLPLVVRMLALAVLVAGVVFVSVSYYKRRNNKPFVMFGGKPELSKEVTGIVEGYEQQIMKDNRLYLLLKAARDITYSDGHHELEVVHLEVYQKDNPKPEQIDSQRAIYDQKNGLISFTGDVRIETHDALKVQTDAIVYNQNSRVGETTSLVNFTRENVTGHSTGALVDSANKRLELRNNVEINVTPEAQKNSPPKADARSQPVTIHAAHAVFEQANLFLTFTGGATAEQGKDLMSGDTLNAKLNEQKKVQKIEARGNAYLRSMNEGRAAEVHSVDMDFNFDGDQKIQTANASRDIRAQTLNADSEMQLNGAQSLDVDFQRQGPESLLKEMRTHGRSVVTLAAPKSKAGDPRAANKRLTADEVKLIWRTTGRDLERAEAVGNAELFVEPVQKNANADTKTLIAPRFDCDFYETGNLAKNFVATGSARAVIEPMQPSQTRSTRTLTSQTMTAVFTRETQDVDKFDAAGDAKFNEQDRNAVAANLSYTASDETVRLRGGEPTVWDSRARTKATEIDSDTRNEISYGRGKTQTTYYSQEQTGGATPFQKVKSPVYIVADRSEFHHMTGVGIYTGNARAWQDDNFVRGDRITLYRDTKRMETDGHVQSALYQAKQKQKSGGETVPVFATADHMWYSDPDRLIHYEGGVDVKQGTDRIQSNTADVYLLKDKNEVERSVAQRDVVVTQPGRKGTGNWAQYTAADETVVLTGSPAHVEDVEEGSTEGARLTVYLRESRVTADGPKEQNSTGRVHSIHKVKKP